MSRMTLSFPLRTAVRPPRSCWLVPAKEGGGRPSSVVPGGPSASKPGPLICEPSFFPTPISSQAFLLVLAPDRFLPVLISGTKKASWQKQNHHLAPDPRLFFFGRANAGPRPTGSWEHGTVCSGECSTALSPFRDPSPARRLGRVLLDPGPIPRFDQQSAPPRPCWLLIVRLFPVFSGVPRN